MSQKVQFLIAVIARPKLLILDEPFTGLDPINMELLKDAVLSLHAEGTTVIFSTHDMDIAERMCDTIFMIFRGKKVLDDTLEAIQARYGQDAIRLRTVENNISFDDVPGVLHATPYGRYTELQHDARGRPAGNPQGVDGPRPHRAFCSGPALAARRVSADCRHGTAAGLAQQEAARG